MVVKFVDLKLAKYVRGKYPSGRPKLYPDVEDNQERLVNAWFKEDDYYCTC